MYNRLSVGNGFLDVDNKAELEKLKEHESSLQRQASSIRQMISKIDDSFFVSLPEKNNNRGQLSLRNPSSDFHSGWEETKRRSPPKSFSKSNAFDGEEPQITETQKYIQSLKAKRSSAIKERIHERAQMLEKMEDMRQHALLLARKKEAEALADKFYLQKVRLRALQRLQANANHKLRLSYAVIRSNLIRQRKSLYAMFDTLHQRCIIRAKGVVYELRVGWKKFAGTIIPKLQNRDWLFVQHERAVVHHRRNEMRRLFLELANTRGKRSVMYKTAKQCHKRLMFRRFLSSFRSWISKVREHAAVADKLSKFCANKVDKGPSILVESCRLFYQVQRKHTIKTSRIVGTPLLQYLYSAKCDTLLLKSRFFRKFSKLLAKKQALLSVLERTKRQYYRQLSLRYVKYWKRFLARRHWYETQPQSVDAKPSKTVQRKQRNGVGGFNLPLLLEVRPNESGLNKKQNKFVLGDKMFYHRIRCSSLKQIFRQWLERSKDHAKRQKITLPAIQQKLVDNLSLKMKLPIKFNRNASPFSLAELYHLHRSWTSFQLSLQNRIQIRSLVLKAYEPMRKSITSRMRLFYLRLRQAVLLRQTIHEHWHHRSQAMVKKYFTLTVARLRQQVRRQKMHRMGMRYFRQCIYARLLESLHRQRVVHTRHTQTVKISPRNRRIVYLALQRLRERVLAKKKKITLIRRMRGRIYSELMLKHLRLWSDRMQRIDANNACYNKGREHFKTRQVKRFLAMWVDVVQDRYERRKRFQLAEKVTLPNLARFCLKEWKAVTEDSLYFNVTQYQKGQLWWKTSLQRRYLRLWLDNCGETHEWDERMQHFQDQVQHPLHVKRALRLWQEYLLRRDRRREDMSMGEAMAIRQEAKTMLNMWRYRICAARKPFLAAYDTAREHYALSALRSTLHMWQENTQIQVSNKVSSRMGQKYFQRERQLRRLLLHWQEKTVSVYRRERRAKRLMRWYRHHRYWLKWKEHLAVLGSLRGRLQTNASVVQTYRNQRFRIHKATWFRKLRNRLEYRRQKAQANGFRQRQLLKRVFVLGFKEILRQYHAEHANEMSRARTFALQRQQRHALRQWLTWQRFRHAQRRFVDQYRQQRWLRRSLMEQWKQVFLRQMKSRKKQSLQKAVVCHRKLSFRRALRRCQVFVQRRKQFLFKLLSPSTTTSSSSMLSSSKSPRHAKGSSPVTLSLLITALERDQWQKQRASSSRLKEKAPANLRVSIITSASTSGTTPSITDIAAATAAGRLRPRTSSKGNLASNNTTLLPTSNQEESTWLRQWMRTHSLTSTRQILRYWQQRILLHRLLIRTWRQWHITSLHPQHTSLQRSDLYLAHRGYAHTLAMWQTRVSEARHLRRLTNVHATLHRDTVTQQRCLRQWHQTSVSRAENRRVETTAWRLARYRLAWDTWRMRSNGSGRGDRLWMEIQTSSSASAAIAANKGNNSVVNTNDKTENDNTNNNINSVEGIIAMPIVKPLSLELLSKSQAQRSKASSATTSATTSQIAMKRLLVDAVNRSGAFAVRLSRFYRNCLRLHPQKDSLCLAARHRQRDNVQRAERFHLARQVTCAMRLWQEQTQRFMFLHQVVSRHALRTTHTRVWRHWRHWHLEQVRQRHDRGHIADRFHLEYRLRTQALTRWRRFRHLSRAKRLTHLRLYQRRVFVTWRQVFQRHRTMKRILHWMTQKDKYQRLTAAWREWVAETRVERILATHLHLHRQHVSQLAWLHWHRQFHLLLKGRHRRNWTKAKRFYDLHRRTRVFTRLLSTLERKYDQRDWLRIAARFATDQSLRNTLTNLLALRRNRLAENFHKRKAFHRLRLIWQHAFLPWQRDVKRLETQAQQLVVHRAVSRWQRFVQVAWEKQYARGVLPKSLRHSNLLHPNEQPFQVQKKPPQTHKNPNKPNQPPPPPPPPPPPRRTNTPHLTTQRTATQAATQDDTPLCQLVSQKDTLRHYTVYYWQQRQSQVLKRLRRQVQHRRATHQLETQCRDHHLFRLLYRAFHVRWLQETLRRHQRGAKNRFVQARYDVFLRLTRTVRLWDTRTHLQPAYRETQMQQATRVARRVRMKRGLAALRWLVQQQRVAHVTQAQQARHSRRHMHARAMDNDGRDLGGDYRDKEDENVLLLL